MIYKKVFTIAIQQYGKDYKKYAKLPNSTDDSKFKNPRIKINQQLFHKLRDACKNLESDTNKLFE